MNTKLTAAQATYFAIKKSIDSKLITEIQANKTYNFLKELFSLTRFELSEADPEFREFVLMNNFLVSAIDVYGYTDPYQDFSYSFDRLNFHLDFSQYAFSTFRDVADSNFETVLKDLDIPEDSELNDWDIFEKRLNLTREEIIFEQGLISLLTTFEAYITHILYWIFQRDDDAKHKIRVNIDYDEVLSNIGEIIDFLIVKKIEQMRSWDDRIDTIQSKPIQIRVKDKPEYRIIKDAITKRNILIHNKGIVNNKFLKEISNNDVADCNIKNDYSVEDKIKINRSYYYQVQGAINNLVKFIDDKVKEKYT